MWEDKQNVEKNNGKYKVKSTKSLYFRHLSQLDLRKKKQILIILEMTNLMHKILFYNKFIIFLYMFRALLFPSSGAQIVLYSIW